MWKKIKLILNSVREYKKYAIMSPFFMVGEAACECCIPFVMTLLLNTLQDMQQDGRLIFEPLLPYVIILLVLAIVSVSCGIGGGIVASKASCGLGKNLRKDVYEQIQNFSFSNIDKFHSSSLITRITTDINNIQMAFQMCIRIVIRAPLMLIFSTVMAFISGGLFAFIFVGLIPVVVIGFYFIMTRAVKIFRKVFKQYDDLNESVQENVSGIRVVKSYVREDYEQQKFNKASDTITGGLIKAEKLAALATPLMNTSIHISNILVLSVGAAAILGGWQMGGTGLRVADLSALITYGIQILTSLMMISMVLIMFTMSIESLYRVSEVLEEKSTITNPENPLYALDDGSVIFKNVSFKYFEKAEKNTLSDINLDIKSGQFIGILGSTGSGKTSLVNLISRLYDISSGDLIVGGHSVKEYDLKTLRDNVAVVLQKNILFSGTIEENLRWGDINASTEEIEKACEIAQAKEFIDQFPDKYQTHIDQGGANVSGGQKQRLCIARALLKKPKILILDDSTSAVDTKTDNLIKKGLREVIPNTTKIVIAQRISSVQEADQIIMLKDGMIEAIGNHEHLLKISKTYKETFETQNKKGGK